MSSNVYCVLPYNSLSLDGPGRPRLCCNNHGHWEDYSQPFITDLSTPLEVLNSRLHKSVRKSISTGQRHPSCSKCWSIEDSGGTSFRQIWNGVYSNLGHTLKPDPTADDGTLLPGATIQYLDITFGNKCNLTCRMCNWMNSHLWLHDITKLGRRDPDLDPRSTRQEWFEDQQAMDVIMAALEHVTHINFLGGEPLIVRQHMEILHECVRRDLAKQIRISYNSNLTSMSQELLDLWSGFLRVNVNVSLEAVGTANDYIRHNSSWTDIMRNLDSVSDLAMRRGNMHLELHTTFGLYNCFNSAELIDWCRHNAIFNALPFVNIVYGPTYQDVRLLPPQAKAEIRAEISQALVGSAADRYHSLWIGALNYMDGDPSAVRSTRFNEWPEDPWLQFWCDVDEIDALKSRRLEQYLPRLARLRP